MEYWLLHSGDIFLLPGLFSTHPPQRILVIFSEVLGLKGFVENYEASTEHSKTDNSAHLQDKTFIGLPR